MKYGGLNIEVFAKHQDKPVEYIHDLANEFFLDRLPERSPHISFEAFIEGYEHRSREELKKVMAPS